MTGAAVVVSVALDPIAEAHLSALALAWGCSVDEAARRVMRTALSRVDDAVFFDPDRPSSGSLSH